MPFRTSPFLAAPSVMGVSVVPRSAGHGTNINGEEEMNAARSFTLVIIKQQPLSGKRKKRDTFGR